MEQFFDGPKLEAINKTLEGVVESLNKVVADISSNKEGIQSVQQIVQYISQGISSKVENSKINGLQQVVGKLQIDVAANTTFITVFTNQIDSVRDKINSQDKVLKEILHHLRNPPTPTPSFAEADRKDLQMVAEFGVLATASFIELADKVEK
ncbi:hypothetical protein L6452_22335 [Arctium lappa]|uniref:Uncharacterized protein n=1 Tax=Arctium lappa TaxID=4217 RepID=A0ACB9AZI7_ARCLA|nr:hypothetical protein L6452_22335 [Arctium lappa]